jgi:hypothetical protein
LLGMSILSNIGELKYPCQDNDEWFRCGSIDLDRKNPWVQVEKKRNSLKI